MSDSFALQVNGLGRIYGPGGAEDVAGTGPEFNRSVSPSTGAVVGCWDVGFEVEPGEEGRGTCDRVDGRAQVVDPAGSEERGGAAGPADLVGSLQQQDRATGPGEGDGR